MVKLEESVVLEKEGFEDFLPSIQYVDGEFIWQGVKWRSSLSQVEDELGYYLEKYPFIDYEENYDYAFDYRNDNYKGTVIFSEDRERKLKRTQGTVNYIFKNNKLESVYIHLENDINEAKDIDDDFKEILKATEKAFGKATKSGTTIEEEWAFDSYLWRTGTTDQESSQLSISKETVDGKVVNASISMNVFPQTAVKPD